MMTKVTQSRRWMRNVAFLLFFTACTFGLSSTAKATYCTIDGVESPWGFIKWQNCGDYSASPCDDSWARYNQCDQACRNSSYGWGGGFAGYCSDEQISTDPDVWVMTYFDCTCWG